MPKRTTCALCGLKANIIKSHIVPDFVRRWARDVFQNEEFWHVNERKFKKGFTQPRILCADCDNNRFKQREEIFAEDFFKPYQRASVKQLPYGPWLRYFCVSLSWRILHYYLTNRKERPYWVSRWDQKLVQGLDNVETRQTFVDWQRFLLDESPEPLTDQYLFLLDYYHRPKGNYPERVNWFGVCEADRILGRIVDAQPLWGFDSEGRKMLCIASNLYGLLFVSAVFPRQLPELSASIITDSGVVVALDVRRRPILINAWVQNRAYELAKDWYDHHPDSPSHGS